MEPLTSTLTFMNNHSYEMEVDRVYPLGERKMARSMLNIVKKYLLNLVLPNHWLQAIDHDNVLVVD